MLKLVISNSIYESLEQFKGNRSWRETYHKFTDKGTGIRYEQFGEDTGNPCKHCIFWQSSKCSHPYHDIKGTCTKPYKIETK